MAAGVARGSAVVPGLDEASTQQYRAARGLENLQDGEALTIAPDGAGASGALGYADAPGGADLFPYTSHVSHHGYVVPSEDLAPGQHDGTRDEVEDYSRFAPQEHHAGYMGGEPDAGQAVEGDTAEIERLASSAPSQDPSLQMPTDFAQPQPVLAGRRPAGDDRCARGARRRGGDGRRILRLGRLHGSLHISFYDVDRVVAQLLRWRRAASRDRPRRYPGC